MISIEIFLLILMHVFVFKLKLRSHDLILMIILDKLSMNHPKCKQQLLFIQFITNENVFSINMKFICLNTQLYSIRILRIIF